MRLRSLALATAMVASMGGALALGPAAPAQAATADQFGYALVDNPAAPVWTLLNPAFAVPAGTQGGKVAPGQFMVRFPGIGLGARGIVHVTAMNTTGVYCEVVRWGQSGAFEMVHVACFAPGGIPADSRFTVMWTVSSGVLPAGSPSHAYAQVNPGGGLVQAYNSTGAPVVVTPALPGIYTVRFVGVGSGVLSGNVQATALHPNILPRRCKVGVWGVSGTDILARVHCFDQTGALANTEFFVSYHRQRAVYGSLAPPANFGYVWHAGGGQTNYNNAIPAFGANVITPGVVSTVRYPLLAVGRTHAQVTGYGTTSNYCHLAAPWVTIAPMDAQVYVICFTNAGAPVNDQFLNTFASNV